MKEQPPPPAAHPGLDFDGDYGRTYRRSIRNSVPGYDALIEIAAAALQQAVPGAASILVVGPGLGEELVPLLAALPQARCELLSRGLEPGVAPPGGPFDAVVCHNVLHLMPPEAQLPMLQTLASCVPPGGALLLSAHSEPADGSSLADLLEIAGIRLRQRGLPATLIEQLMASRDTRVFSLDQSRLEAVLADAGMAPPLLLQQSLFSRLWLSRRPS